MAAKWFGIPPWDLEQMPVVWRDRALAAMEAEAHAREVKAATARR
jgi:hypothetical protein